MGEIGLDFHHATSTDERLRQIQNFEALVQLYKDADTQKPLLLHLRKNSSSRDDVCVFRKALPILTKMKMTSHKIHFYGSMTDAQAWYRTFKRIRFGFTAKLLVQTSSKRLGSIVRWLPTRSLVAETDAPHLRPMNMPGPNHPWNVHKILDRFAELKCVGIPKMYNEVLDVWFVGV